MQYPILLEPDEGGWIVASCPLLPGCVSQWRTMEEARANIREAIEGVPAARKDRGLSVGGTSYYS